MSENALLYELLVNKQKIKSLNNKHNEEQSLTFTFNLNDEDKIFDNTYQIFKKYCQSSTAIKNDINLFNDFLESEMPLLINKFEKYTIGKTE